MYHLTESHSIITLENSKKAYRFNNNTHKVDGVFWCNSNIKCICIYDESVIISVEKRSIYQFSYEGGLKGKYDLKDVCTSICNDGNFLYLGFSSGAFEIHSGLRNNNRPIKTNASLTTSVDGILSDPNFPYILFYSFSSKNSIKLIDRFAGIVNKHWPNNNQPLGYVTSCLVGDFGILVGNKKGAIFLYRDNF